VHFYGGCIWRFRKARLQVMRRHDNQLYTSMKLQRVRVQRRMLWVSPSGRPNGQSGGSGRKVGAEGRSVLSTPSIYCAFQKFVESLARPSNCCAAPPNCGVETDSMNSRRIAVVRALYCSILLAETSPSLLIIEKHGVESQEALNCR
jgi:hypothetical protein